MSLAFRREIHQSLFRDPRNGFNETSTATENRYDPITEELTRVFPLRRFRLNHHDWAPVATATREKCPFCPDAIDRVTPLFPQDVVPEGRLRHGQTVIVPNISPYAPYSGVAVLGTDHYLPLTDFPSEQISDGLGAATQFINQVQKHDPLNARFPAVGWNYMPYAGGSIVHPHMQVMAGPQPSNRHKLLLDCSHAYYAKTGENPWENLVTQEKTDGTRYLRKTGSIHWLSSFAPRGIADFTIVFTGKSTLNDLTPADMEDFAQGMRDILAFYDHLNIPGFNFALYPAPEKSPGYWLNARITGRFTVFDWTSDVNTLQILFGDFYSLTLPEDIAQEWRSLFPADV